MKIQHIALIRYLGALAAGVIALPSLCGFIYLLFHPTELLANWGGFLFCMTIGLGGSWLAWRWMTIRGIIDNDHVELRGWIRSYNVPLSAIYAISEIVVTTHVERTKTHRSYHIVGLHDETICKIPGALELCRDWDKFLLGLRQLANKNKKPNPNGVGQTPLSEKPVDDWTPQDFEDYESR